MTERRSDRFIAAGLFAAYTALLVLTARQLGYARDEGFYFHAAQAYRGWFELLVTDFPSAFQRSNVDRFFVVNHEHPAFMKLGFMLSHELFHAKLPVFSEPGTAYRFFGMAVSALGVSVVYLWGSRALGRLGGLVAALSFAFMPRVFHHAHLACFDVPIASLLVTTAYAYARSLESGRLAWALATGVLYGIALDTKHNAWLLPIALVAYTVVHCRGALFRDWVGARSLLALLIVGPLVFFLGWPWIWFDTVERLAAYVRFHREHDYYNMEFLGQTYWKPPMPRGYAWLMTLGTVPAVTLILFVVGVVALGRPAQRWWRAVRSRDSLAQALDPDTQTNLLWLACVLVLYAPWWSTDTPIFGGTKHWMPAYPFLCLLAGRGFTLAVRGLESALRVGAARAQGLGVALACCVLVGPVMMSLRSFPWGLSFYTPVVGGAVGAANLGLNRTFWGYTTGALSEVINERAPRGAGVFLHDTAVPSWEMLQRDGRVRADLRGTLALHASELALYHHEPHMSRVEYQVWVDYGTAAPTAVATYEGVPVVWLYERPR